MPTFDASGNVTAVEDTFVELLIPSSGSFNAYMVQAFDVGQFRWMSLHISGSFVGTLTFYASNNAGTTGVQLLMLTNASTGVMSTSTPITGIFTGAINFRYLTVQWSAWTSGSATATLELYYQPAAGNPLTALAFNIIGGGSPTLAAADNQGQEQRVSLYGTYASAGDLAIKVASDGSIATAGDGILTTAVAASVSTDTVIRGVPGRLYSILVTTLGTNAMQIFDNASAGSGKIIGIVPASSPVNGIPLTPRMPAALGITVKGNVANPAVTISYT